MSQERVLNTLMSFGLTRMDAQVYILLAKKGPRKAVEIGRALRMSKPQLYRSLKNLEGRGIVSATLEHPAKFSALPFDKALDLLAKAKMKQALEEAHRIQDERASLLANWQALNIGDYTDTSAKFMIIEGRNNIYARIQQMITETKNHISTMTTVPSLARADQFGLFDVGFQHPLKPNTKFRFLTDLSEQNAPQMKTLLNEIVQAHVNFEGRNPDLGLKLFPRMVIRDEEEILIFLRSSSDVSATEQDNACIWTNCRDLVRAFMGIFEQLWRNSTDVQAKIEEIETAKPMYAEITETNYAEALFSAKNEIILMTSSEGLIDSWKKIEPLREQPNESISIKIMAPITSENLQIAQQLSEFCEVKHIPGSALGATVIDGKHLFQFTNLSAQENPAATRYSKNTYYTADQEYVGKIRGMLENMWANASAPSAVTLESILAPSTLTHEASGHDNATIDLVRKDDKARLGARNGFRGNVTIGMAVIHPPRNLNLLDTMIWVQKSTKDSDFGASNTIIFFLCVGRPGSDHSHRWPGGFSGYVPLAILNDNPRSTIMFKALYAGSPAAQNFVAAESQQFEVWKKDDTLFAGWTMPIPLLPPKYSLPPSCILFEGIGEPKHRKGTATWPSGYKSTVEYDDREAFVTFINPSSKYSGPGTDGRIRTNMTSVTTPP